MLHKKLSSLSICYKSISILTTLICGFLLHNNIFKEIIRNLFSCFFTSLGFVYWPQWRACCCDRRRPDRDCQHWWCRSDLHQRGRNCRNCCWSRHWCHQRCCSCSWQSHLNMFCFLVLQNKQTLLLNICIVI